MLFVYAAIDPNKPYHSLDQIKKGNSRSLDNNNNGIVDKCDSLSEPTTVVSLDSRNASHPLSQISLDGGLTSVDEAGTGWPDVCESLSNPSETATFSSVTHKTNELRRTDTNFQSVDSNNNGWPDTGDCILSKLNTDPNNCGACGNVCPAGCSGGVCDTLVLKLIFSDGYLAGDQPNPNYCSNAFAQCNSGGSCVSTPACIDDGIVEWRWGVDELPPEIEGTPCTTFGQTTCYCGIFRTLAYSMEFDQYYGTTYRCEGK